MQPRQETQGQGHYSYQTVLAVWDSATVMEGRDPKEYRKDCHGNPIRFCDYGDCHSPFGWEIDHIVPLARGGSEELSNLQALQWRSCRMKNEFWPLDLAG